MINRKLQRSLLHAAAVTALCLGGTTAARAQVSVSVGVPGVYGQIDLGDVPAPQTIYAQPVVIDRGPAYVSEPEYLHVPVGQERNWKRYCGQYNACGRPVYFVKDDWYRNVYVPHHHDMHARADDHRGPPPERHDDRHDDHRDDHHDDRGHDRN
jgi:hypothetical protein